MRAPLRRFVGVCALALAQSSSAFADIKIKCTPPPGFSAINTVADFLAISNANGRYFLCTDLDFGRKPVETTLSTCTKLRFKGVIDGNQYTLRNLVIADPGGKAASAATGVVGCLDPGGRIENLNFENLQLRTLMTG
jgi:hypothetical protein